jgi:hypothetical protein
MMRENDQRDPNARTGSPCEKQWAKMERIDSPCGTIAPAVVPTAFAGSGVQKMGIAWWAIVPE